MGTQNIQRTRQPPVTTDATKPNPNNYFRRQETGSMHQPEKEHEIL